MINCLEKFGPLLLSRGYDIVPILKNTKRPGVKNWNKLKATKEMIPGWVASGHTGVGILAEKTPACDIDCLNREMTLFMIKEINELVGESPHRVGLRPKALIAFQASKPFRKLASKIYFDKEGKKNQVEILGIGNQWVSHAIHPDTNGSYKWSQDLSEINRADLPELDEEKAKEIIKVFEEECVKRGWIPANQAGALAVQPIDVDPNKPPPAPPSSNTPPFEAQTRCDLSNERMEKDWLDKLNASDMDYGAWSEVGMAICHQTQGSDEGYNMWLRWSEKSPLHDEKCKGTSMAIKWKSFVEAPGKSVTFRSVIKRVRDARMEKDPETEFLNRYVYIEENDCVHDLYGPQEKYNPPIKNFKTRNAGITVTYDIPDGTKDEPDRTKSKTFKVADLWVAHSDKKSVAGLIYTPSSGKTGSRIVKDLGDEYLNTFRMPEFPRPEDGTREHLGVFFDHMEYLFPDSNEREWFIDWMALNIQHPENRCKVTPLHIAPHHGLGRGWIVELMSKLLGQWNCKKAKMTQVSGGSQYNGYMYKSLLCCIEEVHESGKRFEISDNIRDILTENFLDINLKYGFNGTVQVFTNFFFMSNNIDALAIDDKDRRINVFLCDAEPREDVYYDQLYKWSKGRANGAGGYEVPNENICALWWYLMERDLGKLQWKRSMKSASRTEMIKNSQSDVEEAFLDFLEEPEWPVMTLENIKKAVAELMEDDSYCHANNYSGQIKKLVQKHCKKWGTQIRIDGGKSKKYRLWVVCVSPELQCKSNEKEVKNYLRSQYGLSQW